MQVLSADMAAKLHELNKQRATELAKRIDLEARLARFEINELTKKNLRSIMPTLLEGMDKITIRLHEYLNGFPDSHAILQKHDLGQLRSRQKQHWLQMFACSFDQEYVNGCMMVGLAHFHSKVSPHSYIAAYNFFLIELLRFVGEKLHGQELEVATSAISKVVMFDMSMALTAYIMDAMALTGH